MFYDLYCLYLRDFIRRTSQIRTN